MAFLHASSGASLAFMWSIAKEPAFYVSGWSYKWFLWRFCSLSCEREKFASGGRAFFWTLKRLFLATQRSLFRIFVKEIYEGNGKQENELGGSAPRDFLQKWVFWRKLKAVILLEREICRRNSLSLQSDEGKNLFRLKRKRSLLDV